MMSPQFESALKPVFRNASTMLNSAFGPSLSISKNWSFKAAFLPLCIEKSWVILVLQSGWTHNSNMCSILFSVFAFFDFNRGKARNLTIYTNFDSFLLFYQFLNCIYLASFSSPLENLFVKNKQTFLPILLSILISDERSWGF